MAAASTISVVTWVTNVFEAATAISGPAWRNSTASASRVIAEPTVLVTATIGQPCSRAQRVGAIVSAVSPDWVTAMTSTFSSSGGGAYRNSEPTVTRAGSPVQSWIAAAPTSAAYDAVPHATSSTRVTRRNTSSRSCTSGAYTRPACVTRPASDWRSASGCSWISLSMKWS